MTPAPTQTSITTALRSFLLGILPTGTEVILSQVNRVPEPKGRNYVLMTPILRNRLSTNVDTFDPEAGTESIVQPTRVTVQLDVHGPASADNAQIISTLFRDAYAIRILAPSGVSPFFADDPNQMAFVNGEQQYEDRWTLDAVMQVNQSIAVPAEFANELEVDLIDVDASYPA